MKLMPGHHALDDALDDAARGVRVLGHAGKLNCGDSDRRGAEATRPSVRAPIGLFCRSRLMPSSTPCGGRGAQPQHDVCRGRAP